MQISRKDSAVDSCRFLKGLAIAATKGSHKARVHTNAYINSTALKNCVTYADMLIK